MSGYSRIEKMVVEAGRAESLREACSALDRGIVIHVAKASGAAAPPMVAAAVALALRCFRGPIAVRIDHAVASVTWRGATARELAMREARAYGQPERLVFDPLANALELGIGEGAGALSVGAAGWSAAINAPVRDAPPTAVGAALAVALGMGKLFGANVLRMDMPVDESIILDLGTFGIRGGGDPGCPADAVDLGRIGLLGAGAIGSAFGWILSLSGWRARVAVIDHDAYDQPNEETSVTVGRPDVLARHRKATHLAARLRSHIVEAEPHDERVDEHSALLRSPWDAFVCAVDNVPTRRALDGVNARVLVNAAVGGDARAAGTVLWTRHGRNDPPLSRFYSADHQDVQKPARVPEEVRHDECSRTLYEGVSMAAPFVALTAASLLIASCAHAALGMTIAPNEVELDVFKKVSKLTAMTRR